MTLPKIFLTFHIDPSIESNKFLKNNHFAGTRETETYTTAKVLRD